MWCHLPYVSRVVDGLFRSVLPVLWVVLCGVCEWEEGGGFVSGRFLCCCWQVVCFIFCFHTCVRPISSCTLLFLVGLHEFDILWIIVGVTVVVVVYPHVVAPLY